MFLRRLTAVWVIGLMCCHVQGFSYDPPVGIPEPDFGIEEPTYNISDHCPNWPTQENSKTNGQQYDCFYVDNTHPNATDSNNPYGYPDKPRMTIPEQKFTEGTLVDIHGGPYTASGDRFNFGGEGTKTDYILITGKNNEGGKPVLQEFVGIIGYWKTSYLILEGVEVYSHHYGIDIRPFYEDMPSHDIAVRDVDMHGDGTFKNGVGLCPNSYYSSSPISNVVVYHCRVWDNGQFDSEAEDDTPSFIIGQHVHNFWVLENEAWNSGGDGAAGNHGGNRTCGNYYIGRNKFWQHRENCIDIKEVNDVIISENECYNIKGSSSDPGTGIVVHYGQHSIGPNRAFILNNTIYDCVQGIQANSTEGSVYILGNVIYNVDLGILMYSLDGKNVIANNNIINYKKGIKLDQIGSDTNYYVCGNVFYNRESEDGFEVGIGYGLNRVTMDYNLYYPIIQSTKLMVSGSYYTLAYFKENYHYEIHSMEADPEFADNSFFLINKSSPVINTNEENYIYSEFMDMYNIDIRYDIVGTRRPQGSAWDIGAYEYVGTGNYADEDVNQDGAVTVNDVQIVVNVILGTTSNNRADVNGSGTTDVQDVQAVVNEVIG